MAVFEHEVEQALTARDDVNKALLVTYGPGEPILVLVQPEGFCSGPDLRDECAALLDDHGDRVVVVLMREIPPDAIPERSELLSNTANVYRYQPPASPTEVSLAEIWNDILNRQRTGVLDDFLDLGGDSLKVTLLIDRVFDKFDVVIDFNDFIEDPTIRALAAFLDANSRH